MGLLKVGVLALQGAFFKHIEMLRSLGVEAVEVRKPEELRSCNGLIIPGGESTTMMHQIRYIQMENALKEFAESRPLFGTCAGLILMAKEVTPQKGSVSPLGIMDVVVERNAFGSQTESFHSTVNYCAGSKIREIPGFFIRAPKIREISPAVKILAEWESEPILVQEGIHLGATFHPELTDCTLVHEKFLSLVKKNEEK